MALKVLHGVIPVLLLLSVGLSFFDDFQTYTDVTDTAFTLNYSAQSDGTLDITASPLGTLTFYATGGTTTDLGLNLTKANGTYPFTFSYILRKNSTFDWTAGDNALMAVYYTNATNITQSATTGYRLQLLLDNPTNNIYFQLYRATGSVTGVTSGVKLNESAFLKNYSLIGLTNDSETTAYAQNDIDIIVTMDENKIIYFYWNDLLALTYYDSAETYISGGFGLSSQLPKKLYIDDVNFNYNISSVGETPLTNNGYSIYAYKVSEYNRFGWNDATLSTYATTYSPITNALNVSHLIHDFYFQVRYNGIPISYKDAKSFYKNTTFWIQADTHTCTNFFKITNSSDAVYLSLGFSLTDKTAIPIKLYGIVPVLFPVINPSDPSTWTDTGAKNVFFYQPYGSFACSSPTKITNVIAFRDNVSHTYNYWKLYTGIGVEVNESGETGSIPETEYFTWLNNQDTLSGGTDVKDPLSVAGRLFEVDSIMVFIGMAVIGLVASVGGFMAGGMAGLSWFILMIIAGLVPSWVAFLMIAGIGLGIAVVFKSGVT